MTNADLIIAALRRAGVQRLFGVPGGGSTADLIEAARLGGLPFTLAQTESGSAFMATAQAEITCAPAACVATLGPGAASLVNGVANALLDRVPLVVLTDCVPDDIRSIAEHQNLGHERMFAAVTKSTARATADDTERVMCEALEMARSGQPGPVHVDVPPDVTVRAAVARDVTRVEHRPATVRTPAVSNASEELIRRARRPVFLVGLAARTADSASALRAIAASHRVPALMTYKAKGVVPDPHPWYAGMLTNGALERPVLDRADLFIAVGFDPVELLPRRWALQQPVIAINPWPSRQQHVPVAEEVTGDVTTGLRMVSCCLPAESDWSAEEVAELVTAQRSAMRPSNATSSLLPHEVVEIVARFYPGARATVDAGAHMFPVMSLWPASQPSGVLISNGLSTMGFALPAAIGAALLDRAAPVVAFTGDGGLLMCLGELQTAVREDVRIRIIVLDDRALSLIRIKQLQRGYASDSTGLSAVDWRAVGTGLGLVAHHVDTAAALRAALSETASHPGPVLIAATVSPSIYAETIRALRG
jgi:acetolactate synthase I/II/III large subunit